MPMPDTPSIPPQAVAALNAGRKIDAIRIVRETQGIGLKEARELVDSYTALHPDVQWRVDQQRSQASRRWIAWLVLLGLAAWAAVQYLSLP
jgi:hypothetical protein